MSNNKASLVFLLCLGNLFAFAAGEERSPKKFSVIPTLQPGEAADDSGRLRRFCEKNKAKPLREAAVTDKQAVSPTDPAAQKKMDAPPMEKKAAARMEAAAQKEKDGDELEYAAPQAPFVLETRAFGDTEKRVKPEPGSMKRGKTFVRQWMNESGKRKSGRVPSVPEAFEETVVTVAEAPEKEISRKRPQGFEPVKIRSRQRGTLRSARRGAPVGDATNLVVDNRKPGTRKQTHMPVSEGRKPCPPPVELENRISRMEKKTKENRREALKRARNDGGFLFIEKPEKKNAPLKQAAPKEASGGKTGFSPGKTFSCETAALFGGQGQGLRHRATFAFSIHGTPDFFLPVAGRKTSAAEEEFHGGKGLIPGFREDDVVPTSGHGRGNVDRKKKRIPAGI